MVQNSIIKSQTSWEQRKHVGSRLGSESTDALDVFIGYDEHDKDKYKSFPVTTFPP